MVVVAEEDRVNHEVATVRNGQASRYRGCCASQTTKVNEQPSQEMCLSAYPLKDVAPKDTFAVVFYHWSLPIPNNVQQVNQWLVRPVKAHSHLRDLLEASPQLTRKQFTLARFARHKIAADKLAACSTTFRASRELERPKTTRQDIV